MEDNPEMNPFEYRELSATQHKVLAILPIPSSLLSITGSAVIIYMVFQGGRVKPRTPYNRLLFALSLFDIISSCTLSVSPFLNPEETSHRPWVIGTDTTCSVVAFLNQLSYASILYNAALSYYFLLVTRFQMKNSRISRRIEPVMHLICIAYPLITASIGLGLELYGERPSTLGCWVKTCGYDADGTQQRCPLFRVQLLFGGAIFLFALFSLIINNIVIWRFARRVMQTTNERQNSIPECSQMSTGFSGLDQSAVIETSSASLGVSMSSSAREDRSIRSVGSMRTKFLSATQKQRLELIRSQALFYVVGYFICNVPSYIFRVREAAASTYKEDREIAFKYFAVLVLQSALVPVQGFFNMMVYVRPKYLMRRMEYPMETRAWALRRAIFGKHVKPERPLNQPVETRPERSELQSSDDAAAAAPRQHNRVIKKPMESISEITQHEFGNTDAVDVVPESEVPKEKDKMTKKNSAVPSGWTLAEFEDEDYD